MTAFYSRMSYSFGNEDWLTERKALKLQPTDKLVCITASGDRPLNLLLDECKEIHSVDANPIQNFLLQLKKAAISNLAYTDCLPFLGAEEMHKVKRWEIFHSLRDHLTPQAKNFWISQQKTIEQGVLYQGAIEKLLKTASFWLRMVRRDKIERLFAFEDLEEQQEFLNKEWDQFFWRKTFQVALNPAFSKFCIKDPGLYAYLDPSVKAGKYIYERMHASLSRNLAKENPLISLIFLGKVNPEAYPPCLKKNEISTIKTRLNRIHDHNQNVINFLEEQPDNSIDCFSLSDIASYMSYSSFVRMLTEIKRTAKPGSRFCLRQFLSYYPFPSHLAPFFERDDELEKELETEDRCFVYRFIVGKINK